MFVKLAPGDGSQVPAHKNRPRVLDGPELAVGEGVLGELGAKARVFRYGVVAVLRIPGVGEQLV